MLFFANCSAISKMWSTLIFPIIPGILEVIVMFFALCVFVKLDQHKNIPTNDHWILIVLHIYNVLACIWAVNFISALTEMILAGTFATWYWTMNKNQVPSFALSTALKTTLKYHLGTVAFGSMTIMTIFRIARMICGAGAKGNGFGVLSFFRRFMFIVSGLWARFNRNAYIVCAIHGNGLHESAIGAYQLILRNVMHCFILDEAADIILVFSGILLGTGAGVITYVYLYYEDGHTPDIYVIVIVVVGSIVIASAFFSVYSVAVNTMVVCFRK